MAGGSAAAQTPRNSARTFKEPRSAVAQTPQTVRLNPARAAVPAPAFTPQHRPQAHSAAPQTFVPSTPTVAVPATPTVAVRANLAPRQPESFRTPAQTPQTVVQKDDFQRPHAVRPPKPVMPGREASSGGFDFNKPTTTVVVDGKIYQKLDRIGKGGSCNVYKVISQDHKISALKEVDLTSADESTIESYENEIRLLQNLQGSPYIIKLIGWQINKAKGYIHIVMECGDADLNTILKNRKKAGQHIDENYLRLYWQQMLEAVHIVHQAQVIHSDLKPANFLFVEGALKLIDFGIATQVEQDMTSAFRGSAVGTLNYMAPESIQNQSCGNTLQAKAQDCLKVGPAADVWSMGCILYLMAHGKTPFQHLNPLQKLQAIVNRDHKIDFPQSSIRGLTQVLQSCFERDPKKRPTIPELLAHKFLKPNAPPTPRATATPKRGGLSQQQLYAILKQLPLSGGVPQSPGVLARRVFSALNNGGDITNFLESASPMPPARKFSLDGNTGSTPQSAPRRRAAPRPSMQDILNGAPLKLEQRTQAKPAGAPSALQQLNSNALASRKNSLKPVEKKALARAAPSSGVESMLRQGFEKKFKNARQDVTEEATLTEWHTSTLMA